MIEGAAQLLICDDENESNRIARLLTILNESPTQWKKAPTTVTATAVVESAPSSAVRAPDRKSHETPQIPTQSPSSPEYSRAPSGVMRSPRAQKQLLMQKFKEKDAMITQKRRLLLEENERRAEDDMRRKEEQAQQHRLRRDAILARARAKNNQENQQHHHKHNQKLMQGSSLHDGPSTHSSHVTPHSSTLLNVPEEKHFDGHSNIRTGSISPESPETRYKLEMRRKAREGRKQELRFSREIEIIRKKNINKDMKQNKRREVALRRAEEADQRMNRLIRRRSTRCGT